MKPIFVLAALFVATVVAIVSGYSDVGDILNSRNWSRVLRAVPVLSTALVLTVATFAVLLLAFWLSSGERRTYENALLGYSYIAPFIIVLVFLPGAQTKPDWAPLNYGTMLTVLVISQVASTHVLRNWFWSRGVQSEA